MPGVSGRLSKRASSVVALVGAALLLAACGAGGLLGFGGQTGVAQIPGSLAVAMHRPPLAPAELRVIGPGGETLAPDGWINRGELHLVAALTSPERGVALLPQVELRPVDEPLIGTPTLSGAPGADRVVVPASALTAGKKHHWQVRAREVGGKAGPWMRYEGAIGYAPSAPAAPTLVPLPNDGYLAQRQVHLEWKADAGEVGIAGYGYTVAKRPDAPLPDQPNAAEPAVTVTLPEDGEWFFRVRVLDRAGNWSEPAVTAIYLDTVPPAIAETKYRTAALHPTYGTAPISFTLTKTAEVSVAILPAGSDAAVRTYTLGSQQDEVRLEWDGRDEKGAVVPPGGYRLVVEAVDRAGNRAEARYDRLLVTQKRIAISLAQQSLWAYDGDRLVLSTLITSGGPELATPAGVFQVQGKYSPFTFRSPWPRNSPYWYPDSPASFALLFADGGFFIHDAPWRGRFGPGSNVALGTPGGDTTGTHGCINVPYGVAARLFAWADAGTPVIISY